MLPTGYPFASLMSEGLSLGLPLTPVSLGNALFGTNHCGTSPAQLIHQAVLQSTLGVTFSPLTPVIGSGAVQSTGQVGILPGSVQLTSLNPLTCVNPLALYSSMGTVPAPLSGSGVSTAADVDAHTIVRAPVLYKKSPVNSDGDEGQATGVNADASKTNKETSPPDRIVASYAAAAHAAALANHQPVSKAAEVFLAATNTGSGRCRHSKRSRPHGSTSNSSSHLDPAAKRLAGSTAVSSSSPTSSTADPGAPVASLTGGVSDEWRRIVDRMSGKVIYIAPDGISLNNTAEVCEYFRTRYPSIVDTKNYEALIASTFVFEPVTEAPSLDNALTFIPSVPTAASSDSPSGTCGAVSTAVTNTSGVPPFSLDNNAKPNPSICRIAFNPSVVRSDGSNLFGRKTVSESPTETTKTIPNGPAQSTDTESTKKSPSEQETPTPSFSMTTVPEVVSEATTSIPNSANLDANAELSNEYIEESVKASNDSSAPINAQTQPVSENDAQDTQNDSKVNGVLSSDSSSIVDAGFHISASSSTADLTTHGESNSNSVPVTTVEATVARMSTETLTTGILNSAIPSCSSTVIPSVVPPASGDNLNLLALAGLVSEPSMLYSCGSGEVGTTGLSLNSLLSNSRLTPAQTHTQQQQLSALISALSTGSTVPQSTYQAPTALIGANSQLNSLVLAGSPQYAAPWSAMGSTPVSWSDLNGSTVMSTLSALQHHQHHQQQQQQLAAAAALQQQQQQIRAAWAAQVAALQRQQMLAGQQQQQQLALAAAGQVQAYLAALQRNLSIG